MAEVIPGGSDEGGRLRLSPFVPRLVRTEDELAEAVSHISRFDHFVVDVESTFGGPKENKISWVGIAVPDRVVLIPMGHPLGRMTRGAYREKRLPPDEERRPLIKGGLSEAKKEYKVDPVYGDPGPQLRQDVVFEALRPLFFSDRLKINHNIKFDIESMSKYWGALPPGPFHDTLILTHVLDENLLRYGLKDLVTTWLKVPTSEKADFYPNLGKIGVWTQPMDQVARYLAKDVWFTLIYYQSRIRQLNKHDDLVRTYEMEMALLPVLMEMELRGVRIDTEMLALVGDNLREEAAGIAGRIWSISGVQWSLSNNNEKRKWLFEIPKPDGGQKLKPLSFTEKTNTPQVNQTLLEHYAPKNETCRLLLEWGEKDKLISTFIVGLTEKLVKERLHTNFNQHRTVTGRLSSNDPNLQQIPRGDMIRGAFIADDGHLLAVADYDQVELRCAAYLSGDTEMIRVFKEGLDIHAQAAAAMLGIPIDQVDKDQRQLGKTQNFGTLFGAGPHKVAEVGGVSLEQAEEFIALYYQQFSGLSAWKEEQVKAARRNGSRKNHVIPYTEIPPFGRRRRLPELYGEFKEKARAERQVINALVQGFAASVLKLALIDLHYRIKDTPVELLLTVHDEVMVQAPEGDIDAALALLTSAMEGVQIDGVPILGAVPLTADGGIGKRWSDCK